MRHDATQPAEPSPPRPLRCAVYTRVSVDDRQDSDMPSVEVQSQACRAYIEAQRHQNWQSIETVYEDSGYSGGDLKRPALRQLLDDVQSDKVDIVVVHRLDRLSRSVQDICVLLPLFTIPGIRLVSVTQPLDTGTPEGRLNLHLLTSFAQFERELIGERTREKLAAIHHLREQFRDPHALLAGLLAEHRDDPGIDEARIIEALNRLDAAWHLFIDKTRAHLMLSLVERVTLQPDGMAIRWNLRGLAALTRQILSPPATDPVG